MLSELKGSTHLTDDILKGDHKGIMKAKRHRYFMSMTKIFIQLFGFFVGLKVYYNSNIAEGM